MRNTPNNTKTMKVLVVGGAGYIGGSVTDILSKKNIPYTVYDNLLYEDRYLKPGGTFINGDVRDTKKLAKALRGHTHVIWLAAIVGDGACYLRPLAAVEINEKAVRWLSKNFSGRILFTSTCSVYGSNEHMVTEEDATRPLSLYATTKVNAEQHLKKHSNAIMFRLGTAYGLSDTYSRPRTDLLVNTLTMHAVNKGVITVFGGNQKRPLIHVKNIAQTLVHNLTTAHTGIFNIATENYNIADIAKLIQEYTHCRIKYTGKRFEDNRHYHADIKKARRNHVLSADSKKTVAQCIREVTALAKSGRIKDEENDLYSNVQHIAKIKI